MSDDEQGYAPASYLEPVEDVSDQDVHPENLTDQGEWVELRMWVGGASGCLVIVVYGYLPACLPACLELMG